MLYFFRLLFLLINIDQTTNVTWFSTATFDKVPLYTNGLSKNVSFLDKLDAFPNLSLQTFGVIAVDLWKQIQDGLTLADIENLLFLIICIRFLILAIRFNLKTSFYITCIGLFAGYLWYRHLIDLIAMYRSILIRLPYVHKLGIDAIQLGSINRQMVMTDLKLGDNVHWYNPGQLIYYSFIKGIISFEPQTGLKYYIDPISMFISRLNESDKTTLLPFYYKMYNKIIPQIFEGISKFWTQLSGIAAYAVITRIGKRYCPYLVRWHWTFLLIIGFIEQILIYFCYRISYFQSNILIPRVEMEANYVNQNIMLQVNSLNILLTCIIFLHLGLIFLGLFHAIWGQYFYFPFLVENTELHIGPRPKTSIYSGGHTSWQDEKEKKVDRVFPKLWYGWFGKKTEHSSRLISKLQTLIKAILTNLRKLFPT